MGKKNKMVTIATHPQIHFFCLNVTLMSYFLKYISIVVFIY